MSALVILECNACGATTPPWPTADRAREEAGPDGWAVEVDGSNIDYCPQCTAPAGVFSIGQAKVDLGRIHPQGVVSRLDIAREGIAQLRHALIAISSAAGVNPEAMGSVANLARLRAESLLAELAS